MASWTTPKTWVANANLTAAEMNSHVRDNETWLKDALSTHGITSDTTVQVVKTARYGWSTIYQGITVVGNNTDTAVKEWEESGDALARWDDAGFIAGGTATRFVIPSGGDGTYQLNGYVSFSANATGHRQIWVRANGSSSYARVRIASLGSADPTGIGTSVALSLTATEYVELMIRQNSGSGISYEAIFQGHRIAV